MNITLALQNASRPAARLPQDPKQCRQRMRGWALRWRLHARDKERFDQAELCLGNALGWRSLAEEAR